MQGKNEAPQLSSLFSKSSWLVARTWRGISKVVQSLQRLLCCPCASMYLQGIKHCSLMLISTKIDTNLHDLPQAWRWVQIPSKEIKTSWAFQHWPHEIMGLCQIAPTRPGSLPWFFWGPLCRTKSPNSIQQLHPRDFPGWQACTHRWCMHTGCTLLFHSGPGRWPWSEHLGSRNGERTTRHHLPPDLKASQVA